MFKPYLAEIYIHAVTMEQQYGICRVSVAHLRTEPSDRAELSSQLLFGEHVEILEKTERWWLVRTAYDGYEAWMDFRQLTEITLAQYIANHDCEDMVPLTVSNTLIDAEGTAYYLSPGSYLPNYEDGFCRLNEQKYEVLFTPHRADITLAGLLPAAMFFLNVPYLWGGRMLFGIDCSGFVQIVFKLNGIRLKRDASQQAEEGELVSFLPEVLLGDLAFFDNEDGKITHVGMMINPQEIIHASGKVRIDPIDGQGIYNAELGKYTHKLRIIKRYTT